MSYQNYCRSSTKRLLTEYEIKSILSIVKPQKGIPSKTAKSVAQNARKALKQQLVTQMIYPEMIPSLKDMITQQYMSSKIQPGESVGVIGAQSIGEKQTQTTLNTFHQAGSGNKTVTTGVPRVEELLNATKDPKAVNCMVFMKDHHDTIADMRKTIGYNIVELTFRRIAKSYDICTNKTDEPWYNAFKILYGDDFTKYTDCISLKINMDILYEYKISMENIANIVTENYSDMICVFSEIEAQMDIFVDTSDIDLPENRLIFIDTNNARDIYLEEVVQPILYDIVICGIPGIENIYFNDDANSFDTDGSNFQKLLGVPFIDPYKTISNNVWDIYKTLGIEAARNFLIEEFMGLMTGINRCHIQLLTEKMTHGGYISSISRYSMRHEECGPIGKASFEETMDNFLKAGVYGQKEKTQGVSASIICGKVAQIGTGLCELKMDVKALPNNKRILHDVVVETSSTVLESIEDEVISDEEIIPRLTKKLFQGRELIASVFTGTVEMEMYDEENKEIVFQNDTKRMREVKLSWNNGIVLDDTVFAGYDATHEVYTPLDGMSLLDQGVFLKIMTKPRIFKDKKNKIIKGCKKSNKDKPDEEIAIQMGYLDF